MAIDTAAKRQSAIMVLMPFRLCVPIPDGSIDQGDRQTLALAYSGILAEAASAYRVMRAAMTVGKPGGTMSVSKPSATMEVYT